MPRRRSLSSAQSTRAQRRQKATDVHDPIKQPKTKARILFVERFRYDTLNGRLEYCRAHANHASRKHHQRKIDARALRRPRKQQRQRQYVGHQHIAANIYQIRHKQRLLVAKRLAKPAANHRNQALQQCPNAVNDAQLRIAQMQTARRRRYHHQRQHRANAKIRKTLKRL